MSQRQYLSSMCYREVKPGIWMKPCSFMLYVYRTDCQTWYSYFVPMNDDKPLVWTSYTFAVGGRHPTNGGAANADDVSDDMFLHWLKSCECWSRHDVCPNSGSEFQLRAIDLGD